MKRYIKSGIVAVLSSAAILSSCDLLERQQPQAQLAPEQVWVDNSSVRAAIIGAYSSLQSANSYGLRHWAFAGLAADEISWTGTFPTFGQIDQRQVLANNVEWSNLWNTIYAGINRSNNIIANVPGINDASLNKEAAIGEARFLRALNYMNLLLWFGGTPEGYGTANGLGLSIFDTPTLTPGDAEPKPRSTEAEVWTLINADLQYAIDNLPTTGGPARATRTAAVALRARAAMYQNDWPRAYELANSVIAGDGSDLAANFADLYLNQNVTPESIFELQFDPTNSNSIAFFFFPTARGGRNELAPNQGFLTAHEAGDRRLAVNNGSAAPSPAAGTTAKYYRITNGDDHVIILRRAELYLIAAEAAAKASAANLQTGVGLLNEVRERAGLPAVTATSVAELETLVLNERRIELAFEGHRWFDLRRTNRVVSTFSIEPFRALMPIPEREVLTAGGVVAQNPQY
ncbi:RagB/SusD family nutrient uptake outer membrane protein [Belliella sp. DSM 111904]|uniref:RagB/SusD family nutrient uptake outer membrane protein n=1 Tax=Belliella filtrata TaxID=2923435 RepID=A0ABS9V4Y1_9BACT|nr:RagB/SusD family nutrient uptake outer membrane protein [Belliella filtrata]MCH7411040.1 RagB/SusD family nutrient uptake outer membrane protein [Belliella filtrata]